jgi:hypothetical protein
MAFPAVSLQGFLMTEIRELRPARPGAEDQAEQAYMPKLPWKWILGLAAFLGVAIAVYQSKQREEAESLRSAIVNSYQGELGPVASRYKVLSDKVYGLANWAANREGPVAYADPRLDLDALHKGKGLYLRVRTKDARGSRADLLGGAAEMFPDAIGRCLGLAPASAAELLVRGSFLEPGWLDRTGTGAGVMKLRVVAEELRQRTKRDLPFVAEALGSQWFLLVLERGETRRDSPVDVYLWDLRKDQLLLSKRVQADGALVAARVAVAGVKPGHYASGAQTGAAQDCSIASQLRAMTGSAAASFEASPPAPQKAMEPAAPAKAPEAPAAKPAEPPKPAP